MENIKVISVSICKIILTMEAENTGPGSPNGIEKWNSNKILLEY